ncbi:MAG: hypothetical protein ABF868_11030 [Sporolactobacillus sp.]
MTMKERDQLWQTRLTNFENSGLSGVQWCLNQEIPLKQFRYWRKKFRRLAREEVDREQVDVEWATLQSDPETSVPLWVWCGSEKVEIHAGFDPHVLTAVLTVLRHR